MANLFRPTYSRTDPETGEKRVSRLRKWYGKYRDADGVLHKVPLCQDKTAAQAMLTDLVRQTERQQAGLVDPAAAQLARAIEDHVNEYRAHLLAKGRCERHANDTRRNINRVAAACRLRILSELQRAGDSIEGYLADRREVGRSYRTVNADLISVRSFCRWLIDHKRMHSDPTQGLERLNVEEDRRRERRPLTDEESRRLIETTLRSEREFRSLSGPDRALMYLLAQRTGLRRNELNSLSPQSFDLTNVPPTVTVRAGYSKRRRTDVLPLTEEVAEALRICLATRSSTAKLWPGGWWRRSSEMLKLDLKDAAIEPVDAAGRVVDFHGQRTTFITGLARAGIAPAMAQKLARHSDVNLTLNTYTHLSVEEMATAMDKLSHLGSSPTTPAPAETPSIPADDNRLHQVVEIWSQLSEPIRQAVMALIGASKESLK